ncbi:MAG: hypothetical protein ACYC2H_09740 [Thermoplasmatota archaeon]
MSVRFLVALFALTLTVTWLVPVNASTVEEATDSFVSYQFDAETTHDAPDLCDAASTEWALPIEASTDGMLVAPDDVSDVFVVEVPSNLKGTRLHVGLSEIAEAGTLELTAFAPGCAGSVLDRLNWPTAEPSPPEPAAGQTRHGTDVAAPWRCDSGQWVFVLDQLQDIQEPASIHLAWTDGTEGPVDLSGRYGNLAVYATDENLGVLLKGAWANVDSTWTGRFSFAVGPCDAVDGGAVYGDPPVAGMDFLEFTPVRTGRHVVQVTYREPVGEVPGPIVVPMSCHMCIRQIEDVWNLIDYRLTARAAS